jgi:hypothetical protein
MQFIHMFPKREQNPFCFTQDFLGKLGGEVSPFLNLKVWGREVSLS